MDGWGDVGSWGEEKRRLGIDCSQSLFYYSFFRNLTAKLIRGEKIVRFPDSFGRLEWTGEKCLEKEYMLLCVSDT